LKGENVNVIKLVPHSIITEKAVRKVGSDIEVENGRFIRGNDILKAAVIERHKASGNIGLGLVEGFGLKNGAIASTVAHDSHNLIVIGDNDKDMILAIEELEKIGGGVVLASKGNIIGTLPLEIAGIMSDRELSQIQDNMEKMLNIAYNVLKVNKDIEPFMTLSFIALPVIPKIKLTDMGLFSVEEFKFIELS